MFLMLFLVLAPFIIKFIASNLQLSSITGASKKNPLQKCKGFFYKSMNLALHNVLLKTSVLLFDNFDRFFDEKKVSIEVPTL